MVICDALLTSHASSLILALYMFDKMPLNASLTIYMFLGCLLMILMNAIMIDFFFITKLMNVTCE